jgi:hypothetical protein
MTTNPLAALLASALSRIPLEDAWATYRRP